MRRYKIAWAQGMNSRSALNVRIASDMKQLGIFWLLYQDEWWEDIVTAKALG
jgi:hypothetical protein